MVSYCLLCRRTLDVWNRSKIKSNGCKWCYPDYRLDTPRDGLSEGELKDLLGEKSVLKKSPHDKVSEKTNKKRVVLPDKSFYVKEIMDR